MTKGPVRGPGPSFLRWYPRPDLNRRYRRERRPKGHRTTLEIGESAGQSDNGRLGVVGHIRLFLDLVLPQCCPRTQP